MAVCGMTMDNLNMNLRLALTNMMATTVAVVFVIIPMAVTFAMGMVIP